MAKIKFSSLVSAVSGKIGGVVFSNNRGGAYARTQRSVVNANTLAQQRARSALSFVANAWRALTVPQREAWTSAALLSFRQVQDQFGDSRSLTGPQFFNKVNLLYQTIAPGELLLDPGNPVKYPDLLSPTLTIDTDTNQTTVRFNVADSIDPAEFNYVVYMTKPTPEGQTPRQPVIVGVSNRPTAFGNPTQTVAGQQVTLTFDNDRLEGILGTITPGLFVGGKVKPISPTDPWDTIESEVDPVKIPEPTPVP